MTSWNLIINDGRILYRYLAAILFFLITVGLAIVGNKEPAIIYISLGMLFSAGLLFFSGFSILKRTQTLISRGIRSKAQVQDIYTERASYMIEYTYQVGEGEYKKREPTFFVDRYLKGFETDIIYDPDNPRRAILIDKIEPAPSSD